MNNADKKMTRSYSALIYYRVDGQLQSIRHPLGSTTRKDATAEARRIAQSYHWKTSKGEDCYGRVVTVDMEVQP